MNQRDVVITDEMRWRMVDASMSDPVPLNEADLTKPFVYQRSLGVFYVPSGFHMAAMSLLLAWNQGQNHGIDIAQNQRLDYPHDTADAWLETAPGAAFRSSVGKRICVAASAMLTADERIKFGDVVEAFPAPSGSTKRERTRG